MITECRRIKLLQRAEIEYIRACDNLKEAELLYEKAYQEAEDLREEMRSLREPQKND